MTSLYFEKKGQGPPVVFLHGLWGGGDYFKVLDMSFDKFTRYYIDELGFGKSDKPANSNYDLWEHAKYVADVIPDGSIVVAHSFGALIALELARKFPDKVKSLVLISPPLYVNRNEALKHLTHSFTSRMIIDMPFLAMLACKLGCGTNFLSLVSPFFFNGQTKKFIRGCTQHTWHSFQGTFHNSLLGQEYGSYQDVFDTKPTLLIYGGKDKYISQEYLASLKGKRLKKKIIKDFGHSLLFAYFGIDALIREFLGKLGA